MRRDTNQNVANVTHTPVSFETVEFDSGGYFDVAQPTRLTFPETGVYLITGTLGWDSNNTQARIANLFVDGAVSPATNRASSIENTSPADYTTTLCGIGEFTVGQYVQLVAWQNSGATRQLVVASWVKPRLAVHRLS